MRRNKYQDKYIKYILEHDQITYIQKLWLIYWFLDRNGYPTSIRYIERQLNISKGKTKSRITDPLIKLKIIKKIGEKYLGDPGACKATPIFDFTDEVEEAVKAMVNSHDDGMSSHSVLMTRHFYADERQNAMEKNHGDHNNKVTNETKEQQDFDEFCEGKVLDFANLDFLTGDQQIGEEHE